MASLETGPCFFILGLWLSGLETAGSACDVWHPRPARGTQDSLGSRSLALEFLAHDSEVEMSFSFLHDTSDDSTSDQGPQGESRPGSSKVVVEQSLHCS